MPDDVIRITTAVDLSGLQSGMPQAASLVEQATERISKSFEEAQKGSQSATESVKGLGEGLGEAAEKGKDAADVFSKIFKDIKHPLEEGNWKELSESVGEMVSHPFKTAGTAAKDLLIELGPIGSIATGVALGLKELGEQAFELVNEEGLAARQTQNMANMLSLGYEATKKLGEQAKLVDVDISSLARASFRLAEAIDDPAGAGKDAARALNELGISATDSGEALLQVLQKLSELPDKTKRVQLAHELLGRASFEIEPLIENYERLGEVVESLGGKLSGDATQGLLDAREKVKTLGIAWDHLKEALAAKLSGVVTITVKGATGILTGEAFDITGLTKKANEAEAASQKKQEEEDKAGLILGAHEIQRQYGAAFSNISTSQQEWADSYHKSLEGLHEQLTQLEDKHKQLAVELSKPASVSLTKDESGKTQISVQHPFDPKEAADFAEQTKKIATLKAEIKAAETKDNGHGLAEQNAVAEKRIESDKKVSLTRIEIAEDQARRLRAIGASTIEAETAALVTAENQRYEIEVAAAEKINALKAKTAAAEHRPADPGTDIGLLGLEHQKRTADIQGRGAEAAKKEQDEIDKISEEAAQKQKERNAKVAEEGQKALDKLNADGVKTAEKVAATKEQSELSHSERIYSRNKDLIQAEFEQKKISIGQKIELLKQQEQAEYNAQMAAASTGYQRAVKDHGAGSDESAKAELKIVELADQYSIAMAKLNGEASKAAATMEKDFVGAINGITEAFNSGLSQWLGTHKKFTADMEKSFEHMADTAILNIAKQTEAMLVNAALEKVINQKSAISAAYVSAANTYKNVTASGVGGPFNPVIAAAEAAGVFIAASAFASFEIGGVVPKTQMALVHSGERVLTQRQNEALERGLGGDGGTHNHFTYNAAPGESQVSISRNMAALQRAVRDGQFQ